MVLVVAYSIVIECSKEPLKVVPVYALQHTAIYSVMFVEQKVVSRFPLKMSSVSTKTDNEPKRPFRVSGSWIRMKRVWDILSGYCEIGDTSNPTR